MTRTGAWTGLVALGAAAAVGQAALLREAMAALGGSELAWGAVLGLWLAGTGAGSWLGAGRRGPGPAGALPGLALALALAGVLLLRAAPVLAGAVTGESASTWRLAWLWCLAVLPPAAVGGFAFAILAGRLAGGGAAGMAYALEAAGAFAGGVLFTFALAPTGSAGALVAALGLVAALPLVSRKRWLAAGVLVVVGLAAAGPVARRAESAAWRWANRGEELQAWRETREQRLEMAGAETRALYADGRLVGVHPDPWRVAPRTHLLMLLHPAPRRVLAVGPVADGSLAVMVRHPIDELDVIEEDPALVDMVREGAPAALGAALSDPRVRLLEGDPLRALARTSGAYDLILLLDGDPTTLRRNRTRTREFFRACAAKLGDDGRLVVRVGVSDTYLGGVGGRLLATLAATLGQAVASVAAVPGEEVLLVGASSPTAASVEAVELAARWRRRGVADAAFDEAMLPVLVDPGRQPDLAEFLAAGAGRANTAALPRAVLLAAALMEGRGSPGLVGWVLRLVDAPSSAFWAGAGAVGALAFVAGVTFRAAGVVGGAVIGFSSMAWWLLLLAAWQSRLGSVYAEVGLLSGLFMAGVAAGAVLARRRGLDSAGALATVMAAGAGVSLALASGGPLAAPRLLVVPLLIVGGGLTGAGFPAVARLSGGSSGGRGAGRAFGADEVGAGAAAFGVGLIGLAWMGMSQVALGLAVVEVAAAAGLAIGASRAA